MKLINSTALSRMLGEKPHWIHNQAKNKTIIGRMKMGGKTYYSVEYAKKLICKLKPLSESEYNRIVKELDEYRP